MEVNKKKVTRKRIAKIEKLEIDKKKKDSPVSENKRIKKATLKVVERSKKKEEEQENGNTSTLPASVEEEKGKDEEDMGDEDDEEC